MSSSLSGRNIMRKQFWLSALIVIFVTSVCCLGQGVASRIQAPGYSFRAPSGWKIRQDKGYALVEPAGRSIVMVTSHQYNDFASALRDTTLEQGESAGEPQNIKGGKTIRVTKRTAEGVTVVDLFVLFSPNGGGGVIVIALSESENGDVSFYSGLNIANSVTFSQSAAPQRPSTGASGWQARLAGKHLLYL